MDRFVNVTAVKKANVYYGGKVASRTLLFCRRRKKDLGSYFAGEYEFGTGQRGLWRFLAGEARCELSHRRGVGLYKEGQSFEISANSRLRVAVDEICDYCCSYSKELKKKILTRGEKTVLQLKLEKQRVVPTNVNRLSGLLVCFWGKRRGKTHGTDS